MRHQAIPFAAVACTSLVLAFVPAAQSADDARTITSGRLAQDPDDYYGNHVRVRGEVARVFDRRAFTLDEDHPLARHDVLVILPRPLVRVRDGAEVVVTGYVRRLVPSELRRDYGWFDEVVPDEAIEGSGRPVVIAESVVMRTLGRDRSSRDRDEDFDDDRGGRDRDGRVAKSDSRFTLRDEDWDGARLVAGRSVVLSDARVEERLGRNTFLVRDDDGREVVVRMEKARMVPSEGDKVDISGVVRRIPTDIDTWDLESDAARRRVKAKSVFVEARRVAP